VERIINIAAFQFGNYFIDFCFLAVLFERLELLTQNLIRRYIINLFTSYDDTLSVRKKSNMETMQIFTAVSDKFIGVEFAFM
jgi:hypothetical protein